MIIKELKRVSISEIVILILLIIILLQKCGGNPENPTAPQITRDTVWVHTDSTILSKPQIIKTEPYAVPIDRWNTEYLPDTNYAKLFLQYELIVRELLAKNIHSDSVKIDSIGHVYITDTVSKNEIIGRSTHYNLKYPVITNTITLPAPKVRQLYWGVGVGGRKNDMLDNFKLGFLYKNKNDYMFGPNLFIQQNGNVSYSLDLYFKLTK